MRTLEQTERRMPGTQIVGLELKSSEETRFDRSSPGLYQGIESINPSGPFTISWRCSVFVAGSFFVPGLRLILPE